METHLTSRAGTSKVLTRAVLTRRLMAVPVALAAVLTVAACGGPSASSAASGPHTPAGASASSPASAGSGSTGVAKVEAHSGPDGTYLTNASGITLYVFAKDTGDQSQCTGACASVWPPLTTTGTPQATGAVKASLLGTVKRSDGATQVTYDGHPLYLYQQDTKPGETAGQGFDNFGAKWWLVAPSGQAITGSSSATPSTSSSSGGGGAWG